MPKSKKPRKPYKKPAYNTSTHGIVPSTLRTPAARESYLKLRPHTALDALADGSSTEEALGILVARVNIGFSILIHYFESPEGRAVIVDALDALRAVENRAGNGLGFIPTPAEFTRIGDGLNLTDELQGKATRKECAKAMIWVKHNMALDISQFAI